MAHTRGGVARAASVVLAALTLSTAALAETLVVAVTTDVLDWHPGRTRGAADSVLLDNVYERLVALDGRGAPVPELASSWQALGPEVWEFRLRPNVRFANGEAFDASVAQRNLLTQRDDFRAASRTWLRSITDVEVVDALTVRIHTAGHVPELPVALAWAGRMAPAAYGFDADGYAARLLLEPVGTGPYRLVGWERGRSLLLERRDDWWGEAPDARRVEVLVVPEGSERAAALLAGDVDMIDDPDPSDLERLAAAPGTRVESVPGQRLVYLFLDSFRALGGAAPEGSPGVAAGAANPLLDARVRRALSLAIDRTALAEDVHHGMVTPTDRPVLRAASLDDVASGTAAHDPDEARALLAEAGYPEGFTLSVVVLEGQAPRPLATLEAIAADWLAVGIVLEIDAPDPLDAARRYSQLDVSAGMLSWGALSARVTAWRGMFGSDPVAGTFGGQNVGRYQGVELNALLTTVASDLDDETRDHASRALLAAFTRETPVVPLFVVDTVRALDERWTIEASGVELVRFRDLRLRR
jgi:peptide/nickel transport system substrate-binding protein